MIGNVRSSVPRTFNTGLCPLARIPWLGCYSGMTLWYVHGQKTELEVAHPTLYFSAPVSSMPYVRRYIPLRLTTNSTSWKSFSLCMAYSFFDKMVPALPGKDAHPSPVNVPARLECRRSRLPLCWSGSLLGQIVTASTANHGHSCVFQCLISLFAASWAEARRRQRAFRSPNLE